MLKAANKISKGIGIDPLCDSGFITGKIELIKGIFPSSFKKPYKFNCITALAVLEHIPADKQGEFFDVCYSLLLANGKLIITVPDAEVDDILQLLKKLRFVNGMNLEQHHKFDSNKTPELAAAAGFKMLLHKHFELRLNNLYVFVKS